MHKVLVNRLGGLSLPRKSVVRLTDRPAMTLDVYHGRKTTMHQQTPRSNYSACIERIHTWVKEIWVFSQTLMRTKSMTLMSRSLGLVVVVLNKSWDKYLSTVQVSKESSHVLRKYVFFFNLTKTSNPKKTKTKKKKTNNFPSPWP